MKTIDIVTNRILEALNENTIPWEKPWSGVNGSNLPLKLSEGKPYTGSNSFLLGIQCRPSRTWGTLKQWVQKGERVKYDEFKKATPIIYFSEAKSKTLK
jgi:antirestriction protein ArdC